MDSNINLHCKCGEVYTIEKPDDFPNNAVGLGCNFCMECADENEDEFVGYMQYWLFDDDIVVQEPIDSNQLSLFPRITNPVDSILSSPQT